MSHIVRLNLTLISGVVALGLTVVGGVWGVALRDADLARLKIDHLKLEAKIETELTKVKSDLQSFRDLVYEMRNDIKWLRSQQEQLAKQ